MASDAETQFSITRYLLLDGDADAIRTLADQAFAALTAGKTVVSVSYEGGSTSSVINCSPAVLLAACMDALTKLGVPNTISSQSQSIFTRFGSQVIQT
jgi:hypothetical protein